MNSKVIAQAPEAFELWQQVEVKVCDGYARGTITGILLDSEGVQYRVVYWLDDTRRHEWMFSFEIESL